MPVALAPVAVTVSVPETVTLPVDVALLPARMPNAPSAVILPLPFTTTLPDPDVATVAPDPPVALTVPVRLSVEAPLMLSMKMPNPFVVVTTPATFAVANPAAFNCRISMPPPVPLFVTLPNAPALLKLPLLKVKLGASALK